MHFMAIKSSSSTAGQPEEEEAVGYPTADSMASIFDENPPPSFSHPLFGWCHLLLLCKQHENGAQATVS